MIAVIRALAIVLVLVAVTPAVHAADGTTSCPDDKTCHFPSPEQCATGENIGAWDGGPPGRGSICVGAAGHDVVYIGGDPGALCGTVIVADVNVLDGPTAGRGSDPNGCPYVGWPAEVHDPAVAHHRGAYYLFGTGPGIPAWRSTDRITWRRIGQVFPRNLPAWAPKTIPGTQFPWAPDISFFNGRWHLYYSISTFGSKRSAIGFATGRTLGPRTKWTDRGVVVESNETTDYNAIDPNVVRDDAGQPWLVFGSFNGGIRVVRLDAATGHVAAGAAITPVASRLVPTWGVEAPFIVRRGAFFYMFVSFDNCCRGSQSTYHIRVGRSASIDGIYVDDAGMPMLLGGGRLVLQGSGTRRGPGHNAVLREGKTWRLFFHYYDATAKGTARLGILPIEWTSDGWPVVNWSDLKQPRVPSAE